MDNRIDKNFYKFLNDKVEQYTNDGTSLPQAISIVSKQLGLNPYKIMQKYYPNVDNNENNSYDDVKTKEGTFVTLKGDSEENQYEVININNKDAIVLRNTNNNEEITASENELTPVITESRMKKINEAQYSVSINGLETQDADALSQLFTAASQAESTANPIDMASNPMPIDMDSGMPMDMNDAMTSDGVIDDVEFDEELPSDEIVSLDTDANAYVNPEMDAAIVSTDSLNDDASIGGFDPMVDSDSSEEEPFGDEPISDMSMDTMMDDGMFDDEIAEALKWAGVELNEAEQIIPGDDFINDEGQVKGEQEEYAEDITENVVNQAINAGEDFNLDDSEMIEEDGDEFAEGGDYNHLTYYEGKIDEFMSDYFYDNADLQSEYDYDLLDEYKNEIYTKWKELVKNGENDWQAAEDAAYEVLPNSDDKDAAKRWDAQGNWDDEIEETLRLAGVQLNEKFESDESEEKRYNEYQDDTDLNEFNQAYEEAYTSWKDTFPDEDKLYDICLDVAKKYGVNAIKLEKSIKNAENWYDEIDESINNILRNAGVKLDEEVLVNAPKEMIDKSVKKVEKNDQEPEYTEVDTDTFGKESSEGSKSPLNITCESTVNKDKIKSIYETAKSMYAKKDVSEWNSLDRRYIEKLIKEGCSYSTSTKMLLEAKKGK